MRTDDLIFYEIYPKSFCDSDGDGFGDLEGVRSKIGYLKDLGVNAVWITPCFESPNVDNGYDVANYRKISEAMGGDEVFEKLLKEFHEHGIKVILDLVANHTSDQHEWFLQSKSGKDNPYREYYIWRQTPPNGWKSAFGGGSAWEFDERTQEYYLHSYAVEQPDLNWENETVRKEICAVVDFWLDKGVDGFRCDVLDQISKVFEDENGNGNGPRLHEYIRELFGREKTKTCFTVGECWAANGENVRLFCGKDRGELTTVFAFDHLCLEKEKFNLKKPCLREVCEKMANWQRITQEIGVKNTLFLENHDQPRSVSRFGNDNEYRYESATMLGGLTLLQRGIPFLFQGQEIGLTNSYHTDISAFNDVESLNYYQERTEISKAERLARINAMGRDNARRLIPWTDGEQRSWLAPYSRKNEINVEKDRAEEKSVFAFYKRLIAVRKAERAISQGEFAVLDLDDAHYAFERRCEDERIVVYCGFEKGAQLDKKFEGEILLNNYADFSEKELLPYQLIVIRAKQ